jgi:glycosyltransferase involved in cell wall biosynthesis
MLFTIMILSIPSRLDKLKDLMAKLEKQIGSREDVEVLCLVDNKKQTIGKKRQNVLNASTGQYVACLDDDDTIADDYVQTICDAIENSEEPPDVIAFNQHCTINGEEVMVYFDMRHTQNDPLLRDENGKYIDMRRPPWHMCVWKREIANKTEFRDTSWGEDWDWVVQMYPHVKTQLKLDKVLHYYLYSDEESESLQYKADETSHYTLK